MKNLNKILVLIFVLIFLMTACSSVRLKIKDSWARPARTGENSAAYFTIQNQTFVKDKLLLASSGIADAVEIHKTMAMPSAGDNSSQPMQMVPQESVEIGRFANVNFEPGGLHIMFINLNQDLEIGDTFDLTLNFEKAGEIKIEVPVKQP